ncbi:MULTISPECIES: MoaD/ThiS family protein [Actinopolyspora]|uniref:Molybdopterin converting factor, small subunit n=1 Tax=Actinopolyspora saharensis TaxID=995062 RepID=A0A1H1EWW9_9ACTN|nr:MULTISPECIES: MoaD/ThiS family protein [Actinopolyspora]NHD18242.1 MoaD/ThiS family protein [Actinopolyspora sp. BKK2]NHE77079.1 MoaD/ThiS family protein [Actinopolyspora sp. BKK1]SDQ92646.1 Molybdopterin converting factor, small subunit [Actinopolyspora saharensis]
MDSQRNTPDSSVGAAAAPSAEDAATTNTGTATVLVRYFAGARAAAGVSEEWVRVLPAAAADTTPVTVADVVRTVLDSHDDALARVMAACGFLVDGVAVREDSAPVADGAEFDVLPPFAGG